MVELAHLTNEASIDCLDSTVDHPDSLLLRCLSVTPLAARTRGPSFWFAGRPVADFDEAALNQPLSSSSTNLSHHHLKGHRNRASAAWIQTVEHVGGWGNGDGSESGLAPGNF